MQVETNFSPTCTNQPRSVLSLVLYQSLPNISLLLSRYFTTILEKLQRPLDATLPLTNITENLEEAVPLMNKLQYLKKLADFDNNFYIPSSDLPKPDCDLENYIDLAMVACFSTLLEGEKPLTDEQMKAKIQEVFGIEKEQSAELLTIIKSFKGKKPNTPEFKKQFENAIRDHKGLIKELSAKFKAKTPKDGNHRISLLNSVAEIDSSIIHQYYQSIANSDFVEQFYSNIQPNKTLIKSMIDENGELCLDAIFTDNSAENVVAGLQHMLKKHQLDEFGITAIEPIKHNVVDNSGIVYEKTIGFKIAINGKEKEIPIIDMFRLEEIDTTGRYKIGQICTKKVKEGMLENMKKQFEILKKIHQTFQDLSSEGISYLMSDDNKDIVNICAENGMFVIKTDPKKSNAGNLERVEVQLAEIKNLVENFPSSTEKYKCLALIEKVLLLALPTKPARTL